MVRTHVSSSSSILLHEAQQSEYYTRKPRGFWYECGGSWRRFCTKNDWHPYRFLHRVELNDCNVLRIDTLKKFDAFYREFVTSFEYLSGKKIAWEAVASEFDGVEISPYQPTRRLGLKNFWYYGWDCASGVIWRPKGATVTLLRELEKKEVSESAL